MTGEVERVTCGIVSDVADGPVSLDAMASASTLTPESSGCPRLWILPGKYDGISLAIPFVTSCFRTTPSITNGVFYKSRPLGWVREGLGFSGYAKGTVGPWLSS